MVSDTAIESGAALFYSNSSPKSSSKPPLSAKKQFLRLYLTAQTVTLLPTDRLKEVLTVSTEQIAPMPHVSPWIMGTHNWRGNILWLIDFGALVGLTPLYQQGSSFSYTAAILQLGIDDGVSNETESQAIGLVVNRVGNIERCSTDSFKAVSAFTSDTKLAKFLQGYWLKSEKEILAVLEPNSILPAIVQ